MAVLKLQKHCHDFVLSDGSPDGRGVTMSKYHNSKVILESIFVTTSGNHCLTTQRLKTMEIVLFTSSAPSLTKFRDESHACVRPQVALSTPPFMHVTKFLDLCLS